MVCMVYIVIMPVDINLNQLLLLSMALTSEVDQTIFWKIVLLYCQILSIPVCLYLNTIYGNTCATHDRC